MHYSDSNRSNDSMPEATMATLTVRNLDDAVVRRLRIRAAERGRSAEAEHREILKMVLTDAEPLPTRQQAAERDNPQTPNHATNPCKSGDGAPHPRPCWRQQRPDSGGRSREGHPRMICHQGAEDSRSRQARLSCCEAEHVDARPILASQPRARGRCPRDSPADLTAQR